MLKNVFKKTYTIIDTRYQNRRKSEEPNIPEGLWKKCNKCGQPIYVEDVKSNLYVCPKCDGYFRVHAYRRVEMLMDEGSFEEWNQEMEFSNPLDFPGYEKKVQATREKTKLNEAIVTGKGTIQGYEAAVGICDARFLMSSMGHVVGEKITYMVERATREQLPVIIFACSGGARMQEGLVSLMQMAKTSAALKKHHEAGQLFVSVLTDPTTGGVTASFAMLGDIILAEPGALIGFAGPRVIEQTIGQKLPEGFQRAEFQLEHGFVDAIVERADLKRTLYKILRMHRSRSGYAGFLPGTDFDFRPGELMREREAKGKTLTAWEKVKAARSPQRPSCMDYIEEIFDDFMELHGDRCHGDDLAVTGGIASLSGQPVTVIGIHKGSDMKDCVRRNYGMPSPEGYRKALRLMKQAEKFGRPVITFVNTSGAFCGLEAEEEGQGEAIARNLFEMSALKVPVLCLMIGEGGSGGALALAVGNQVWMMENATYSVLSPEGFASILWKDGKRAKEAAGIMKITAQDLQRLHVVEKIIPEYGQADKKSMHDISMFMKYHMREFLKSCEGMSGEELARQRYERFRRF